MYLTTYNAASYIFICPDRNLTLDTTLIILWHRCHRYIILKASVATVMTTTVCFLSSTKALIQLRARPWIPYLLSLARSTWWSTLSNALLHKHRKLCVTGTWVGISSMCRVNSGTPRFVGRLEPSVQGVVDHHWWATNPCTLTLELNLNKKLSSTIIFFYFRTTTWHRAAQYPLSSNNPLYFVRVRAAKLS